MLTFKKNQLLKNYSTWGIGGPAKLFTVVKTIKQMQEALSTDQRTLVLGKGSNCLFDDQGFDGLVILNKIDFCQIQEGNIYVGAGFNFAQLGAKTARRGYKGLEFASGIPGSVGGAIYMNAGAGGGEAKDTLVQVQYVDRKGVHIFERADLDFGYRFSPFQKMEGAIVAARFSLTPCKEVKKRQIQLLRERIKTQPYGLMSCGCVFRNPKHNSAGALIEKCGLKGLSIGDVAVSERHANFLINKGKGTAADVLRLIQLIRAKVKDQEGIDLEFEVKRIEF